jgi:hypothetical protein
MAATINDLIAAYHRQDHPEMQRLEDELTAAGYYITYGPAGVYWAEPGWDRA